jgi:N-acyl homoserine lactone hydrolase
MSDLSVRVLNTGTIRLDHSHVALGKGLGNKEDFPSTAWLIEGGSKLVLVDTGMCETPKAHWHHPGSHQEPGESICERLGALGIKPEDIEVVVFTHLHWDHCANMKRFTKAQYIVHEAELEFAMNPIPPYYRSYEAPITGYEAPFHGVSFKTISNDYEVIPGVIVIPTPGHSPGHQSVVVETNSGKVIAAGDAVMSGENLTGDPANHLRFNMLGRYVNMKDAWHSLEKLADIGGTILPGHCRGVFKRPSYR